jgi:multicomponent Na+:H+ antiporter subunit G
MNSVANAAAFVIAAAGVFYFLAGTVGLLRFGDEFSRLHALAKADNLGLGLVIFGLAMRSGSPPVVAKLILIWLLVLLASSVSCYLIANRALETEAVPTIGEDAPDKGEARQ